MKNYISITLALCLLTLTHMSFGKEPQVIQDRSTTLIYPTYWHTPFGIHRATQEHLSYFTNQTTQFNQPQGMACMPLISRPLEPNKAIDFQVTVIGVNQGEANLIYNPSLTNLALLASSTQFKLISPLDIAANQNNQVYLSDIKTKQVHYFKPIKQKLAWQGQLKPPPNHWQQPTGLASDPKGNCFITDELAHCIYYYNSSHQYIKTIGPTLSKKITLYQPNAVAVTTKDESWTYYKQNSLYICDQAGKRLIKTTLDGDVLNVITADQLGSSTTTFAWLALDYYDNLWVTAPLENKVYKLDHELNLLDMVGQSGEGDYLFNHPTGIAIHRHFGQVFIAEKNAVHYFWIGADFKQPQLILLDGKKRLQLKFFLTEPAFVSIASINAGHRQVLYNKFKLSSGYQSLNWIQPKLINKDRFKVELKAEATYSTRTHYVKKMVVRLQ